MIVTLDSITDCEDYKLCNTQEVAMSDSEFYFWIFVLLVTGAGIIGCVIMLWNAAI